ncbi:MAG: serine O-acetyltransferase [Spongiibacteraceae bacterium]
MTDLVNEDLLQHIWQSIYAEVEQQALKEPMLASLFHTTVLNQDNFTAALAFQLSSKLSSGTVPGLIMNREIQCVLARSPDIVECACLDLEACFQRDPACDFYSTPFLYYKGYHALQAYRITHYLWQQQRYSLAYYLQNRIASVFDVDIHPAAKLGHGIMIDHATAVVIGETSIIGNNVSLLHSVSLGGCGIGPGKRHPTIGDGVLVSTGAKILGDVTVGVGAKIAAGSVVLGDVAAHTTVAGVPARAIGKPVDLHPSLHMNQL